MFGLGIKRSVAALAVTAGLLAAAGPASAQDGGADVSAEVFEHNRFGTYDPVEHLLGNDTQLAADGARGR